MIAEILSVEESPSKYWPGVMNVKMKVQIPEGDIRFIYASPVAQILISELLKFCKVPIIRKADGTLTFNGNKLVGKLVPVVWESFTYRNQCISVLRLNLIAGEYR